MVKTSVPFSDELLLPALARAPHALPFLRELLPLPGGDAALLAHIVEVSKQAYADIDYPCIIMFLHVQFGIAMHPAYPLVEKLAASAGPEQVAVDVGCAFGSDARWLARHGWKDRAVGCDLKEVLLKHGHALYKDSPSTSGVTFLTGNLFDYNFLADPTAQANEASAGTLTSLRGRIKVLYAASLFHLFSKTDQETLARNLGSLLAPGTSASPSVILGRQVGRPQPGAWAAQAGGQKILSHDRWTHNEESWEALWRDALPGKKIKVTMSREHFSPEEVEQARSFRLPDTFFLIWSVEVWDE